MAAGFGRSPPPAGPPAPPAGPPVPAPATCARPAPVGHRPGSRHRPVIPSRTRGWCGFPPWRRGCSGYGRCPNSSTASVSPSTDTAPHPRPT
ncbi:hypothetical protein DRB89_39820 [Streptomyces sp. ICC4]|nr:hypothetical protein DRB89_39820 [Streptomyces sp. ICC4]